MVGREGRVLYKPRYGLSANGLNALRDILTCCIVGIWICLE
jgi:hypothetical protein